MFLAIFRKTSKEEPKEASAARELMKQKRNELDEAVRKAAEDRGNQIRGFVDGMVPKRREGQ